MTFSLFCSKHINCGYTLAILTSTHNIRLRAKQENNVYPFKAQFNYSWGVRGSTLHGHVSMMLFGCTDRMLPYMNLVGNPEGGLSR